MPILSDLQIKRTYHCIYNGNGATCFIVEHKENFYFVTAKHLFQGNEKEITLNFTNGNGNVELTGNLFFHSNTYVDIVVFIPNEFVCNTSINLEEALPTLGDFGYFLGCPYNIVSDNNKHVNNGFPLPLVKRAALSGSFIENDVTIFLLDGHNNPGFSGGPAFFGKIHKPDDQNLYLLGVVSSYLNHDNKIDTPYGKLEYIENSGIIIVHSAKHIIEIIESI